MAAFIEQTLQSLEAELGVMLTVHDLSGIFHDSAGKSLLGVQRQTHRRNPLCFTAERAVCTNYCNTEISARSLREKGLYFISRCGFGLYELIVPIRQIRQSEAPLFILFAGAWRDSGENVPDCFAGPQKLAQLYRCIAIFQEEKASRLGLILSAAGAGLLTMVQDLSAFGVTSGSRKGQILRFVYNNVQHRIGTSDLARELHVSATRAGHIVNELFGIPLTKLILEERMLRAKALLESTSRTISDIAQVTGFGSEFHFSRTFKKESGISPSVFRKSFSRQ